MYAHFSAETLLDTFGAVREAREARGTPTDEEQDLLRAMVVFTGAGMDSMTKQIIQDALPEMVALLPEARDRIEDLGGKHLSGHGSGRAHEIASDLGVHPGRLARVLLAETPRAGITQLLIEDLTAGSLQSVPELFRVMDYLGITKQSLGVSPEELTTIFKCRNKIIHEMDIDFSQPNRTRFPRRRADMVTYASSLIRVSSAILESVDEQLMAAPE